MPRRKLWVGWQLTWLFLGTACTEVVAPPSPGAPVAGASGSGAGGGASGAATGGAPMTPEQCASAAITPGPSPLRRLNRFEYNNTVADLLKDGSSPANAFPLEEQSSFDNDAHVLRVSRLLVEGYLSAAEALANGALAKPETLPCAATAASGDSTAQEQCAGSLIDGLGARAYRRPLSPEERARLLGVFRAAREFLDFDDALSTVLETMLMSPQFLYRIERGVPVEGKPGVLRVDSWSLASRLSYFLWGSMPDDALLSAAQGGQLATAADVQREATRMYGSERSRAMVRHFTRQWLELSTVDQQGKDASLFPDYSPAIGALMRRQTETFSEHLYFDGGGTLGAMLSAPYTFMNQELAKFMGVTGPTSSEFERVELDPNKHAGILTEPGFLSYHATVDRTHPILRGVFVMKHLLCDPPPAPPPGIVDATGTITDPNATQRDRLAVHLENPSCAACHQYIDPIGLTFENYDAVGRWRDTEKSGAAVNATGALQRTDVDGPVSNAVELSKKLAQSKQVQECVTVNWFRYANGRGESMQDTCSIMQALDSLTKSGGDLRELVLAQTQTDAFLYRLAPEVTP